MRCRAVAVTTRSASVFAKSLQRDGVRAAAGEFSLSPMTAGLLAARTFETSIALCQADG